VKNSKDFSAKLTAHIKKLKKRSDPLELSDPVEVLVYSQLLWESSTSKADEAWGRLSEERVDWHELRVCTSHEIAEICGDKSPLAEERASRLRSLLNHLYQRHHDVTLGPELDMGKRDMREAIDSLDGVTPFVANRWLLLCGDVGDVPIDDQLRWMLANAGCIDEAATVVEVAGWVSRQIKAEDAWEAHAKLQAWVNGQSDRVAKKRAKDEQAEARSVRKRRADAQAVRGEAQEVARQKRAEAAARAAARKAAAEKAAMEEAAAAARGTTVKKSTAKKTAKKAAAKKKTAKKAASKKKTTTKKAASKKKATKKPASKKKTATKKKTTKKPASKATQKKTAKKRSSRGR